MIKFGGNAMVDEDLKRTFAQDVVALWHAGLRLFVVHGGGPQISALLGLLDLEVRFEAGLLGDDSGNHGRGPDGLTGQVQGELVGLINSHGPFAVGMSARTHTP